MIKWYIFETGKFMNAEAIIEVIQIYKTYPGATQPALKGMDCNIPKGSFFGLLGPNGAGKTTLLSIMSGLLKPDSGKLLIAGIDVTRNIDRVKRIIGLVPQDLAIYPSLTARENLSFFGSMFGLRGQRLKTRIDDCLEIGALGAFADKRVETLSGGLKRRLSLVMGLIHEPEILFLDEPTVGIDPQSRHFIYDTLRRLNRSGMTIIYTSHYIEEVDLLCNDIAIIDQGKFIARGSVEGMINQYGSDTIRIRTKREIPDAVKQKIMSSSMPEFCPAGNTITVKSDTTQETLSEIIGLLRQNNIDVVSINVGAANLEQLFLLLTGTRLRDNDGMTR